MVGSLAVTTVQPKYGRSAEYLPASLRVSVFCSILAIHIRQHMSKVQGCRKRRKRDMQLCSGPRANHAYATHATPRCEMLTDLAILTS